MRSLFRLLAITALMSLSLVSASFAGNTTATKSIAKTHRVAIQVDQNDPAVMNLALNNASNIFEHYRTKGESVEVDIVTNGPGLHMLRDTSSSQGRLLSTLLAAVAEFERELIRERTGEGRKRAMANGVKFGRKPKLSDYQRQEAIKRRAAGETLASIAKSYAVDISMISRL